GSIANINLYNGPVLLASSKTSPLTYTMPNTSAGTYTLTAQAVDASGVIVSSNAVTSTIINQSILPSLPTVSIATPFNGSTFPDNSNVTIIANASEIGGSIAKVAFYYNGSNLLCTASTAPYACTAVNAQTGNYTITAVATDANGVTATSIPVAVTI